MIRRFQSIFSLVRFPNLLIIAFTQYAMRYLLMEPLLPSDTFELQFGDFQFALLVFSTMLIAAAGYIINDYFDTRADLINKPARVVVGVKISRKVAMILHAALNIFGVGIGVYLAFYVGLPSLSLVFVLSTGLLWFYSTNYKKQFLVGNLAVAFLTGLVPLMVVLFEIPLLNMEYGEVMIRYDADFNYLFAWVSAFSFFAFITTLIREIIKDAEDFEGDMAYGMKTVPIILGAFWTRIAVVVLIAVTLFALIFLLFKYIYFSVDPADYISLVYFSLFLLLPLIVLAIQVMTAGDKRGYHRASRLIKLVMLSGIFYSVVVFYLVGFKY
ncbi:MAG: geranylgeranylglycerol-phosphate geranylgeranyltransferase [Bacteroidales bacterium]|nr:geranylgeranylglycerol-phosphate geranylgeranyltransferase [Bacteroidales bacterium]